MSAFDGADALLIAGLHPGGRTGNQVSVVPGHRAVAHDGHRAPRRRLGALLSNGRGGVGYVAEDGNKGEPPEVSGLSAAPDAELASCPTVQHR
ncbi:hypothetical protein C5F59_001175 [Streptomyces sp. QL37]|uniref:hypothetical protein n=1 Tax=Streptomyces sp. QL37 TaxID=2093747 RepID=UPI0011B0A643|nr:hypothetical protein [Streptomyces sp. QL37]